MASKIPTLVALLALTVAAGWAAVRVEGWLQGVVEAKVATALAAAERRISALEERLDRPSHHGSGERRGLSPEVVAAEWTESVSVGPNYSTQGGWGNLRAPRRLWSVSPTKEEEVSFGLNSSAEELWDELRDHFSLNNSDFWHCDGVFLNATRGLFALMPFPDDCWLGVFLGAAFGDVLTVRAGWEGASPFAAHRPQTLRSLFSEAKIPHTFPTEEFIELAFTKVKAEELKMDAAVLKVLAWGALRRKVSDPAFDCLDLIDGGNSDVPHTLQYVRDHPEVLAEKSSSGQTLLMELVREPETGGALCTLLTLELSRDNIRAVDNNGDTAAMLALLSDNRLPGLAETISKFDMIFDLFQNYDAADAYSNKGEWLWAVTWLPATSFVALHAVIALVALVFCCCRPRVGRDRCGGLCTFTIKVAVLVTINCVSKYGKHGLVLLFKYPRQAVSICWNDDVTNQGLLLVLLPIFVGFLFHDLRRVCRAAPPASRPLELTGEATPDVVTAQSVFEDPRVSLVTCLQTFVLSLVFVSFYIATLSTRAPQTIFSRSMWGAALVVQVYKSTKSQWGQDMSGPVSLLRWIARLSDQENPELWKALFHQESLSSSGKQATPKLSKAEVIFRFLMSYVANGMFQMVTLYSLPHYLATSTHLSDFVLNSFAVSFIYTLDDLPSPQKYEVVLPNDEGETASESEETESEKCVA